MGMFIQLNVQNHSLVFLQDIYFPSLSSLSLLFVSTFIHLSSLPSMPYSLSTFILSFLSFHSLFHPVYLSLLFISRLSAHISHPVPSSLPYYPFLSLYCCFFHSIDLSLSLSLPLSTFSLSLSQLCLPPSHSLPSSHSISIPYSFPHFYPYRSFFTFYLPSFLFSIPLSLSLSLSCSLFFQPSLNPSSLYFSLSPTSTHSIS